MTEYLTTRELAELLRIKERKVYDLVASGEVPCTRATGKLLFPRDAIDDWLASKTFRPLSPAAARSPVIVGSHDPLLEWALRASRCGLASYFDSSLDGLERFAGGEGIATGLHVYDAASDSWNTARGRSALRPFVGGAGRMGRRARGIIMPATGPTMPVSMTWPARPWCRASPAPAVRFCSRPCCSESIRWFELERAGAERSRRRGRSRRRPRRRHFRSCHARQPASPRFRADGRRAFRHSGRPPRLVRADLAIPARVCRSAEFGEYAAGLAGYDIGDQFRVHFNGAG